MVIIADQFEAQKKTVGAPEGNKNAQKQCHQNDGIERRSRGTAEIIAKDSGLSTAYVERAVQFAKGLNEAEKVSPGIKESILTGKQYEAQKMTVSNAKGTNQYTKMDSRQSDDKPNGRTVAVVAKEHGVGKKTVERAEKFAKGVDVVEAKENRGLLPGFRSPMVPRCIDDYCNGAAYSRQDQILTPLALHNSCSVLAASFSVKG